MSEEKTRTSKAQQRATQKYIKTHYDRIEIKCPKGFRERLKAYAEAAGESVNLYIINAVNSRIQSEGHSE